MVAALFIVGGLLFALRGTENGAPANNVSIEGGVQVVEIRAKGGYQPRNSAAQAGVPTIVRFKTSGTFDCSSFVRFPSLNITQNLSASGITEIDVGTPAAGALQGMCGMGMYRFQIDFQG